MLKITSRTKELQQKQNTSTFSLFLRGHEPDEILQVIIRNWHFTFRRRVPKIRLLCDSTGARIVINCQLGVSLGKQLKAISNLNSQKLNSPSNVSVCIVPGASVTRVHLRIFPHNQHQQRSNATSHYQVVQEG